MAVLDTATVKEYLRISHSAEDTVLALMLAACLEFVEQYCGVSYADAAAADFEEYVDGGGLNLWLSNGPVTEIVSVVDAFTGTTKESSYYRLDGQAVRLDDDERWADGGQRWTVTYKAGYTSATMPATLKLAVLGLIERAYRAPGGKASESGAGHSWNWQALAESDILKALDQYRLRGVIG